MCHEQRCATRFKQTDLFFQCSHYQKSAVSPVAGIQGLRNQGLGVAPLTLTPKSPFTEFLIPLLGIFKSSALDVNSSNRTRFPPWDSKVSIKLKVRAASWSFGLHMQMNLQTKRGITLLARMIDLNNQGNWARELRVEAKVSLGYLLVLPHPRVKAIGKLQQLPPPPQQKRHAPSGFRPFRNEVQVSPLSKEYQVAKSLFEGKGNITGVVEEETISIFQGLVLRY